MDDPGALSVGPECAGPDPGPAGHSRGRRRATVIEANLAPGYLDPLGVAAAAPGAAAE